MKKIKTGKILGLLMILLVLSGCWDYKSIEELAFVTVVGLHKVEDEENMVEITFVSANPEAGTQAGSGGGSNEPEVETISFPVEDFNTAKGIANTVIAKEISYDLLQAFLVSEEFARDENFIRWLYDVTKAMEVRRDIHLIITKEDPKTFVENNQPVLDSRSHKFYELMIQSGQDHGTIPPSLTNQFFQITEADADLFLAIYASTERNESKENRETSGQFVAGNLDFEGQTNNAQFAGSAIFDEGKMIGTLNVIETRLVYLLNNAIKQPGNLVAILPDPMDEDFMISTRVVRDGNVQLNMNLKGDSPSIHAIVPLQLDVLTNHRMTDFAGDSKARNQLKLSFEEYLDQLFSQLIKKTQEEFGSEPFSWSLPARKEFRTIPEFTEFDWKGTYPEMDITVETQITFESFGRQTELPDLNKVRD